jgi:hypothetical protein
MAENIKIKHKDIQCHVWEEGSGGLLLNGNESGGSIQGEILAG